MLLALFCACTAQFVSDLFGNHIVGFPTRRLNYSKIEFKKKCLSPYKAIMPPCEKFMYLSMRCDQKVLSLIHFKAFHKTKCLFNLSFYLIESHLESKKHLVTLDCFCMTVLREDSASNLQNGER